ncbi:hypothetical protein ANANG_G00073440 [Anguilla anguilla]|uniref:Uncharacterized protein n=1 Tax=Anguilla anguilla TaxID=7936 RepID=A0A9D3MQY8_ANGAN|nr:hypothetical protein ANANG_G00073440 [Anguilla anguilla]
MGTSCAGSWSPAPRRRTCPSRACPPAPPPPKRHCRSLSVPEDLSRCRTAWRPSASKIWTPLLLASSLRSSSSPTFFSLALSADSPLPWSFSGGGDCCCFFPCPPSSSCSSSPSRSARPAPQRRFSLSPCTSTRPPPTSCPGPAPAPLYPRPRPSRPRPLALLRLQHPVLVPPRRPAPLPRCHSQPCDMRKPVLKRRHAPDTLPCARPGLDFSKMSQTRSGDPLPRLDPASPACGGRLRGPGAPQARSGLRRSGPYVRPDLL